MTTLFDAIERADAGMVWQLSQQGAELGAIDESTGMTALAQAAEAGQSEIVRTLLDAGAAPDLGGVTTPLEAAVVEGHAEVAQTLIDAGADVNRAVEDGFTPLMTAAATGDLLLVEILLKAGARPRKTNDEGHTAISLAKEAGHTTIVTLLRSSRRRKRVAAQVETPATPTASTPAEDNAGATDTSATADTEAADAAVAAENETQAEAPSEDAEAETAEASDGAPADESSPSDEASAAADDGPGGDDAAETKAATTAVSQATAAGDDSAAPSQQAEDGSPEAENAGRQEAGDEPAAKTTASPSQGTDPGGPSPEASPSAAVEDLHEKVESMAELAEKGKVAALAKHLKNFEAGTEARDPEGRTLLMLAAKRGDVELVNWLLEQGADVEAIDTPQIGHTVLVHATQCMSLEREKIIQRLVEAGADINRPCGQRRRTPLMHAADADVYLDRVEGPVFAYSTKTLIKLGARMEAKDARGNTVWQLIKKDAIGAPTYGASRRRLHQMLRVLEHGGAQPIASHAV